VAYIWIDADVFLTAFSRFSKDYPSTFCIQSYEKPIVLSYDEEQIMLKAFQRNIKRLQGDYRYYTSIVDYPGSFNYTRNFSYGINGSKQIQRILGGKIQTQLFTLKEYRRSGRFGFLNTFLFMLDKGINHFSEFDISYALDLIISGYKNNHRKVAEERQTISEIMLDYSHLSPYFQQVSELLKNESDLWLTIASYNRVLLNKGVFISIPRGLRILDKMAEMMDGIIEIQQEILSISG
jgi:hypothetical protein